MKKLNRILLFLGLMTASLATFAQSPHLFKYQTVARNASGALIANQSVSFRISILKESAQGQIVYQETHLASTNEFGLATLSIGGGNVVSGSFNSI
ncbi:MAG TPA: hypothetical protein VNZ86_04400, partial [Bacteroidia bacterium]|nr:hypothetical protein [Bacteroidia bacterium]